MHETTLGKAVKSLYIATQVASFPVEQHFWFLPRDSFCDTLIVIAIFIHLLDAMQKNNTD